MPKLIYASAIVLLLQTEAYAQSISVKDNSDLALTLSQTNYNRIYLKNDEIWDFAYPQGALALKQDKGDGSVYLMPASTNPFTFFLTTKNGHHFTVTVNGEEALGKTIELIPQQLIVEKAVARSVQTTTVPQAAIPDAILALLNHMERHEPLSDVHIKRQYGKVERWAKGLTLLPKEAWEGKALKGELIELYNGGKEPLVLSQDWFAKADTLAIQFSLQ